MVSAHGLTKVFSGTGVEDLPRRKEVDCRVSYTEASEVEDCGEAAALHQEVFGEQIPVVPLRTRRLFRLRESHTLLPDFECGLEVEVEIRDRPTCFNGTAGVNVPGRNR